jgi:hypothetical protein
MNRILMSIILLSAIVLSQEIKYVGTSRCKVCHKKETRGAQYTVWEASLHAHAFETLKSEQAGQIAKGKGIEGEASEAPECLKCHTTGFGHDGYEVKDETFWNPAPEDKQGTKAVKRMKGLQSVGCESCHGAGSAYKSNKIMKSIRAGEIDGKTVGLNPISRETCIICHNDTNPTFKPFNFEESIKIIAHPIPAN